MIKIKPNYPCNSCELRGDDGCPLNQVPYYCDILSKYNTKRNKEMLDLKFNEEYFKSYNTETLERIKSFLISLIKDLRIHHNLELDIPMIFPSIEGDIRDIDIEWKNDKFQLLITIPESLELAGMYGNNYAEDEIQFAFDITKPNVKLLLWLKKQISKVKT